MSTRDTRHPEQQENEKWVGNTGVTLPEHLSNMKTARLGAIAYDIEGKELPPDQVRPLFIGMAELDWYNDIMMTRTFGPDWRRNT